MMSLVRASGEGGVVCPQKKCFGFVSPESAGAAGDAPVAPSAATAAASAMIVRAPRANERADLTGLPPLVDARVPLSTEETGLPRSLENESATFIHVNAEIGVFGGSGFSSFVDVVEELELD